MTLPRHVSREPRPQDRGRGFGLAHADAVALTIATYRRLLREAAGVVELRGLGEQVGERLPPELRLELEGIAAGARVDVLELLAVNARTELLAGGCSLIARDGRLAQTWDWHPDMRAIVWTIVRPDGSWLTTVTEPGVLAKLGMNSLGVACGLNFLTCSADGGVDGTPIHALLRLVLECASGAQARELLLGARVSASSCVTVAADGAVFAVELSPGGAQLLQPDADGWLVHTNHFLVPPPAGIDTQPPGSVARREHLARLVRAGAQPAAALASHAPPEQPVCRHGDVPGTPWAERRATLLAVWAQPGSLRVAAGPPCTCAFEPVPLP